jgi:CheY-like chemotaxis protein
VQEQIPVILLLEDQEQARFVIRAVLEGAGYGVVDATNEDDALAICGRSDQRIDAMVSDVILSSTRGTDVAQKIKLFRPSLLTCSPKTLPKHNMILMFWEVRDEETAFQ